MRLGAQLGVQGLRVKDLGFGVSALKRVLYSPQTGDVSVSPTRAVSSRPEAHTKKYSLLEKELVGIRGSGVQRLGLC